MPDDANLVFTQERTMAIPTNKTKLQAEFSPFIANIFVIHDVYIKTWNVKVNQKLTFFRSCTKFSYKKNQS
jgi:hypothetical protein